MANNFTAILTGNMGSEARIITKEDGSTFAAFSLATTDSYKDEKDSWHEKETQWHNILVFNPRLIKLVQSLKKGTRLHIEASGYYRNFDVVDGTGEVITKKEIAFVPYVIDMAPLAKKRETT